MVLIAVLAAAVAAPRARADYAVMKTGMRIHITGYERIGDQIRLTMAGGVAVVAAAAVVSIEPEDTFIPVPPPPSTLGPEPFGRLIHAAAARHGVDEQLIAHVIAAESNFNPHAVSRKRAQGLMQLLPKTAALYSVANVFDPAQNIDAGTHYLKDLLERYRGNLPLALAAYNAGPEMVQRYGGIPPFPETQAYVRRITANLGQPKNPAQ